MVRGVLAVNGLAFVDTWAYQLVSCTLLRVRAWIEYTRDGPKHKGRL